LDISNQSKELKPVVANRIGEIHRTTNPDQWRNVHRKINHADLPTMGLSALELPGALSGKKGRRC
jgi:hypothetical protein